MSCTPSLPDPSNGAAARLTRGGTARRRRAPPAHDGEHARSFAGFPGTTGDPDSNVRTPAVCVSRSVSDWRVAPETRKSRQRMALRMARPGLEPGTPRFSVMNRNLSNSRGIPAFEWVLAIDPHQLDVRKLRSFRVDLGTESRFGAQWALAPVAPPRRVACPCMVRKGWRSERCG
jgi:hypothetical protein